MASRREFHVLLVALLLGLAGCAKQTAKPAEAPTSQVPPPRPSVATPDQPAPAPAPPPRPVPAIASPAPPPPPTPAPASPPRPAPQEFVEEPALKDVFFERGRTEIGRQGTIIMKGNAGWLIEHPTTLVLVEGHSDWTGTPEEKRVTAERRAQAARDLLVTGGVSETRIQIVSQGSDHPVCPQRTKACAARNRRVHFLVKSQ